MDTKPSSRFIFNLSQTEEWVRWVVIGIIIGICITNTETVKYNTYTWECFRSSVTSSTGPKRTFFLSTPMVKTVIVHIS